MRHGLAILGVTVVRLPSDGSGRGTDAQWLETAPASPLSPDRCHCRGAALQPNIVAERVNMQVRSTLAGLLPGLRSSRSKASRAVFCNQRFMVGRAMKLPPRPLHLNLKDFFQADTVRVIGRLENREKSARYRERFQVAFHMAAEGGESLPLSLQPRSLPDQGNSISVELGNNQPGASGCGQGPGPPATSILRVKRFKGNKKHLYRFEKLGKALRRGPQVI
jgi:hypothetical protein